MSKVSHSVFPGKSGQEFHHSLLPCSHHKYKVKRFDNLLRKKKKSASKAFMFFSNTKFSVMMFNT